MSEIKIRATGKDNTLEIYNDRIVIKGKIDQIILIENISKVIFKRYNAFGDGYIQFFLSDEANILPITVYFDKPEQDKFLEIKNFINVQNYSKNAVKKPKERKAGIGYLILSFIFSIIDFWFLVVLLDNKGEINFYFYFIAFILFLGLAIFFALHFSRSRTSNIAHALFDTFLFIPLCFVLGFILLIVLVSVCC